MSRLFFLSRWTENTKKWILPIVHATHLIFQVWLSATRATLCYQEPLTAYASMENCQTNIIKKTLKQQELNSSACVYIKTPNTLSS